MCQPSAIVGRMGFFDRAWYSAAEQYGVNRAEKYGRIAKLGRFLALLACLALAAGIVVLWQGRP
jgi:hypothetical protein